MTNDHNLLAAAGIVESILEMLNRHQQVLNDLAAAYARIREMERHINANTITTVRECVHCGSADVVAVEAFRKKLRGGIYDPRPIEVWGWVCARHLRTDEEAPAP